VEGHVAGEIAAGLMILLGVGRDDTPAVAVSMAARIANLRIFEDDQGKMNRCLLDVKGSALVVSQFTLYGDARGQRRRALLLRRRPNMQKSYTKSCARRCAAWELPWRQEFSKR
jgi:D-tyrosyl-tRNA(Tyr) deacylase